MKRSEIRYALYRAKSGTPMESMKELYAKIAPMIPVNQSWGTFSIGWDIMYKDGNIDVIFPETDYDFIHSTCLELAVYAKTGQTMEMTPRQHNIKMIVETNMLVDRMEWATYNKTWGVTVDLVLKRINTKLFKTVVNVVTDEMIANSVKSDGAAMTELPSIHITEMPKMTPISAAEEKKFKKLMKKSMIAKNNK